MMIIHKVPEIETSSFISSPVARIFFSFYMLGLSLYCSLHVVYHDMHDDPWFFFHASLFLIIVCLVAMGNSHDVKHASLLSFSFTF